MIVGVHVGESKLLNGLGVIAHGDRIWAELNLRKDNSNFHR
jgi:hypothetical protein